MSLGEISRGRITGSKERGLPGGHAAGPEPWPTLLCLPPVCLPHQLVGSACISGAWLTLAPWIWERVTSVRTVTHSEAGRFPLSW